MEEWSWQGWCCRVAGKCQLRPTNNLHPQLIPNLSPCSQISICGSNDPASGPCGQSRSRPVIKMKWAADPSVPFRRVEHWPRDLYLIDQPVQREKKVPFLQRGLLPTPLLYFRANVFREKKKRDRLACFFTSCVGIILSSEHEKRNY